MNWIKLDSYMNINSYLEMSNDLIKKKYFELDCWYQVISIVEPICLRETTESFYGAISPYLCRKNVGRFEGEKSV
jgi:hypothetical protein